MMRVSQLDRYRNELVDAMQRTADAQVQLTKAVEQYKAAARNCGVNEEGIDADLACLIRCAHCRVELLDGHLPTEIGVYIDDGDFVHVGKYYWKATRDIGSSGKDHDVPGRKRQEPQPSYLDYCAQSAGYRLVPKVRRLIEQIHARLQLLGAEAKLVPGRSRLPELP
jgi:hypothetical protein